MKLVYIKGSNGDFLVNLEKVDYISTDKKIITIQFDNQVLTFDYTEQGWKAFELQMSKID